MKLMESCILIDLREKCTWGNQNDDCEKHVKDVAHAVLYIGWLMLDLINGLIYTAP